MKVAIDIGHGPDNRTRGVYDPGNKGHGIDEHVVARGMAHRVGADLKALGHKVLYTGGSLYSRDDTAKRWGCDLFVSIHTNAFNRRASGVECWVDARVSARAKTAAKGICANIASTLGIRNRGMKTKWFAVLRANTHDLLVEMMFQDSADFAKYQNNVNGVELAILNGILKALGKKTVTALPRLGTLSAKPTVRKPMKFHAVVNIDEQDIAEYRAFAAAHGDDITFAPI